MSEPCVQIGIVQSVNPARREVRIRPGKAGLRPFDELEWIHFDVGGGRLMRCKVASEKVEGSRALVVLCEGVLRDTVAHLKGAGAYVPEASYRAPSADDHELAELEGLVVVGPDEAVLGRIVAVYETAAHGVMEIADASGHTFSLPLIEPVINEIDFERGHIVVCDIASFLVESRQVAEQPETSSDGSPR